MNMIHNPPSSYPTLKREYFQLKQVLFRKLFLYIMITNAALMIMELFRAMSFSQLDTLFSASILLAFITTFSRFILNVKEKQELVITISIIIFSSAGLINKYYEKVGLFANPLDSFYFGYNYCLFDSIVLARIPTGQYRMVYSLATMIIKLLVIPFNDKGLLVIHIIYVFSGIYLDLDKEKHDKNLFKSYFNSKNQLEKFKTLVVNDIPEGIVIIRQDLTQCLFANKSFSILSDFGSKRDICAHLSQFVIYEGEIRPQSREIITTSAPEKTLLSFVESTVLRNDFQTNQKFSCNVTYTQNRNENNKVSILEAKVFHIVWDEIPAVAVILHDITQQHTILSLKTANAHKDALLATVSHELRTPLNGMMGMIQVLQKKATDSEFIKYLNICKNSGNLLIGLVNSILDLNQIRADKLKLNPEKVNLDELLKDMVQLFELQCAQKGISLKLNISQLKRKYLVTDPNRLSQIFINLIGNALKFTMKGGITISAKESSEGRYVQLAVEDTGIGIRDEDKAKLFKMFGKLENCDYQANQQGVGLGLTISDNLARLLCGGEVRGGIALTTWFGKGSVFSFWIKSQLAEETKYTEDYVTTTIGDEDTDINERIKDYSVIKDKGPTFQRYKSRSENMDQLPNHCRFISPTMIKLDEPKSNSYVLIVDDNPFNITVAEHLITSHGYKVKTALYGQIAIDIMLNNDHEVEPIKVVLMDCQMPVMDGYETTKLLRKLMKEKRIPEIPIVALTANDSETDKEMSREAGMWDHMTKPLKEADLFKILDKYVR